MPALGSWGIRAREMLLSMAQPPGSSAVEAGGRREKNVSTDKGHCPPEGVGTLGPSLSADCWCAGWGRLRRGAGKKKGGQKGLEISVCPLQTFS